MAEQPATRKRKRGKFLTTGGLNRLQEGIARKWREECRAATFRGPGNEWLSELWNRDTKTVSKVLYRTEHVDYSTLAAIFTAVGLTIRNEDYADHKEATCSARPLLPLPARYLRRDDLEALVSEQLAQTGMVTLCGPGGAGKTFLAHCITHKLHEAFPNAIYWVGLDVICEPEHVVPAIAVALGLTNTTHTDRSVCDHIGAKKALIVLDNCEHLLSQCARITESLLDACRNLTILATSREALSIRRETVMKVGPLAVPAQTLAHKEEQAITDQDVAELAQVASVRFFAMCARSIVPEFKISPDNARFVERICRHVDGLPLAIEIVAARLISSTEALVATESERTLNLLPNPCRNVSTRHSTLEEVVDWSFQLLNDAERRLLCRLSVFRGGFRLEGAQEVCTDAVSVGPSPTPVPDLLHQLVKASLIVFDLAAGRYRLLETIRQFAQGKLKASGDSDHRICLHADYYLRFSEKVQPHLIGKELRNTLDRIEEEYPNFRLILDNVALEPAVGMTLCMNLQRLWTVRGYLFEGYGTYEKWTRRADSDDLQMQFLLFHSEILVRVGLRQTAMEKLRQAFRLARLHHRPERIAEALQSLGWLYHLKRRYHLASRLQRMSLQYWRQAGNPYREAICLGRFALISQRLGRYEEARACYERSIALLEVFQDDAALGIVFSNYMLHAKELAIGAQNGEEKANLLNAAHDRGMEALKCCLAVGDESRLGVVFYELGCVEIKRQDYNKAREHLQQGLTPLERSGETGKFLECLLFLLWLGINSQQIPREICPGMMSLLVYISETRSRNGMQWIGSVDEVYRSIHGMLEGRLNDQQKRQARREGRQLERTTATMLAKTLL